MIKKYKMAALIKKYNFNTHTSKCYMANKKGKGIFRRVVGKVFGGRYGVELKLSGDM